jgi:hypothetical protein
MAKSERSGKSYRRSLLSRRKSAVKAVSPLRIASKSMKRAASMLTKKAARGYRIVGTTTDGVVILRAKAKPKHFTSKQIRRAITEIEKSIQIRA